MPSEDDVTAMLINPIYAVSIDPDLAGKHEAIISKQRWIEANKRLIDEIGLDAWLHRLLAVLEGDFPSVPWPGQRASGYRSSRQASC
jgi:hypothetical protein